MDFFLSVGCGTKTHFEEMIFPYFSHFLTEEAIIVEGTVY